ncbi:DUF308 domain-containing protein [Luteimicrobium sp. DT211]|uniref:HdeD family acid-resistance protein n=1 Tax=Luteimicrobium sp. DT211 TaxID=3393412 RepID=UPI003CF9F30F
MTATTPAGSQRDVARDGAARDGGSGAAPRTPPEFRRVWLLAIVRGVLLLVLGLLLLIDPVRSDLATMRWVLGAFMIVDGVVAALAALWHRNQSSWQVWLTQSAVDVVLGLVVLAWPDLTAKALYYVLAAWVIALGVTLLVTAGVLARSRDLEWSWTLTSGVVAFLFGVLLVLRPGSDDAIQQTTSLVFAFFAWVAGAIYVVTGFATRTLALELRSLRAQLTAQGGAPAPARLVLGGVGEGGAARPAPEPERVPASDPEPPEAAQAPRTTAPEPTPDRASPEPPTEPDAPAPPPSGPDRPVT